MLTEAKRCYLEAIRIQPSFSIAWSNLAGIFKEEVRPFDRGAIRSFHDWWVAYIYTSSIFEVWNLKFHQYYVFFFIYISAKFLFAVHVFSFCWHFVRKGQSDNTITHARAHARIIHDGSHVFVTFKLRAGGGGGREGRERATDSSVSFWNSVVSYILYSWSHSSRLEIWVSSAVAYRVINDSESEWDSGGNSTWGRQPCTAVCCLPSPVLSCTSSQPGFFFRPAKIALVIAFCARACACAFAFCWRLCLCLLLRFVCACALDFDFDFDFWFFALAFNFFLLLLLYLTKGNLTTSVAYYREAIRLCPEFADAHSNLGNVLKARKWGGGGGGGRENWCWNVYSESSFVYAEVPNIYIYICHMYALS